MAEINKDTFEKSPLKSKKFLVYLISEIGWKIILACMIFIFDLGLLPTILMLSVILTSGFIQAYAIGGQAAIDKYVRLAMIEAGMLGVSNMSETDKGFEIDIITDDDDETNRSDG